MRVPDHIVNEDGHALAQPHLKVLLVCHVAGLLAEMFHWQCFNHCWVSEQQERIVIPLNPYMVYIVMGGEEIRDFVSGNDHILPHYMMGTLYYS